MKTNTLILLAFYVGIFAILTYLYGFFGFLLGMIVVAMISVIALLPMKKDIYVVWICVDFLDTVCVEFKPESQFQTQPVSYN